MIKQVLTLLATPEALDLYAAIVRRSADLLAIESPAPFVVLYWDLVENGVDPQLDRLLNDGFSMIRVPDLLTRDQMTTMRIPGDGHPNADAYRLFGHALYERLSPLIQSPPVAEASP